MTELEVHAGEELEWQLERYARVRLDPGAAQAKRARVAVMEAAWRQRIDGPGAAGPAGDDRATTRTGLDVAAAASGERHGRAAWGPRRLATSLAAAGLAGLLVGSTAFAGSRAGGPLYDARLALEELMLPADAAARLEAELALAQGRLAEIVEAAARSDQPAVAAAVRGYVTALEDLVGARGMPADRALTAIEVHRAVLIDVLARVPADARAGIVTALAKSGAVIERLDAAGTTPTPDRSSGAGGGAGGTGGGGAGTGTGSGGQGGKPVKDPVPAKSPQPARTATPADAEEPRTPKPKPKPTSEAPQAESGQGVDP